MPKVKLNPWNFPKGKRVRLYWLCSPYRKPNGDWTIKAAFQSERENSLEILEFPWGTLPALLVGYYYIDGLPEKQAVEIGSQKLLIPDLGNGQIKQGFDIDRKVFSFWNRKELGLEKVWRFYVNKNIYYISCIEILRAFLAPSKTLANMILRPYGLESLVDDENISGDAIDLKINYEFPSNLVTNKNVAHLVWVLHNPKLRQHWTSVYRNIFEQAVESSPYDSINTMLKGTQILVKPPDIGSCILSFNAISYKNTHVITRINEYTLSDFPFKKVSYSHHSIKEKRMFTPESKKPRLVLQDDGEDFELDGERNPAKKSSHQPIAEIPPTVIGFTSLPIFIRVPQGEVLIPTTGSEVLPIETDEKVKIKQKDNVVSTDEPVLGGKIQPVEFDGLKLSQNIDEDGLESFMKALNDLKRDYPYLIIEYMIIDIEGDKPFCFANGGKRNCVIVEISLPDLLPCYIFEFSRSDSWSISTLFVRIYSKGNEQSSLEKTVNRIISNAVEGNGHWVKEKLIDTKISLLKHTKNTDDWANRIMNKLQHYGFPKKIK